jgi:geranylgeranyl diphosphate synthase, type II
MIHRYETAALILAAVRVGACIGSASSGELKRLSRHGKALGLAFQITDDLLDAGERNGHEEGCDRKREKATYPWVVGVDAAKERTQALIRSCIGELVTFGSVAEPLRAIARYVVARKA